MFYPLNSEPSFTMRLYDKHDQRLYLNTAERRNFIKSANTASPAKRSFALTLLYSGCRLSEARSLMGNALQPEARILAFRSLKKRGLHVIREVPIPQILVDELSMLTAAPDEFLWHCNGNLVSRITAYRWIKEIMTNAGILGAQACPKGLRHSYGVNATLSGVQIHMLSRWMGHASIRTTAIYATVLGPDQLKVADRMWE